jgi:large subunit ribosomal protein L3
MAGHLGAAKRTVQNLEIVRVDAERQLLLVKGSVPGSRGRDIVVRPTSRAARPIVAPARQPAAGKSATAAKPAAAAKPAPAPKAAPAAKGGA